MTWYQWVWGVATTVGMGVWGAVGFVALWDAVERRRERRRWHQRPEEIIEGLKAQLEECNGRNDTLRKRLAEAQRGSSPWGQISP